MAAGLFPLSVSVAKDDGFDPAVQSHTAFAKYICVNAHELGMIPTHAVNFVLLLHVKTGDGFVLFVQSQLPL